MPFAGFPFLKNRVGEKRAFFVVFKKAPMNPSPVSQGLTFSSDGVSLARFGRQ